MTDQNPPTPAEENERKNQPLELMDFSEPANRFESKTRYTNQKTGQVFELTANGPNPEAIAEYIKNIRVYLEVKTDDGSDRRPEEPDRGNPDEEISKEEEAMITLYIDIIEPAGIEPPYVVDFVIDPPINLTLTSPQDYPFAPASGIDITIQATSGNLDAALKRVRSRRSVSVVAGGLPAGLIGNARNSRHGVLISVSGDGVFTLSGRYWS